MNKGELRVQNSPTEEMKADFLMKPLQGKIFRNFMDWLLDIQYDDPLAKRYPKDHRSMLKEIQT